MAGVRQRGRGATGPLYLETVGVDNLVAYGTLHQHEVELIVLLLQCVLLSSLFAHHTHSCVGQNRLHGQINNALSGKFCTKVNCDSVYWRCATAAEGSGPTYGDALSHDARLLHAPRPSELLHVLAEVALSALGPQACLALPAAGPPAPRTRRASIGRQLDCRGCCCCRRRSHRHSRHCGRRPHLWLWPVDRPLLEEIRNMFHGRRDGFLWWW